jgi:hypothetical protein
LPDRDLFATIFSISMGQKQLQNNKFRIRFEVIPVGANLVFALFRLNYTLWFTPAVLSLCVGWVSEPTIHPIVIPAKAGIHLPDLNEKQHLDTKTYPRHHDIFLMARRDRTIQKPLQRLKKLFLRRVGFRTHHFVK